MLINTIFAIWYLIYTMYSSNFPPKNRTSTMLTLESTRTNWSTEFMSIDMLWTWTWMDSLFLSKRSGLGHCFQLRQSLRFSVKLKKMLTSHVTFYIFFENDILYKWTMIVLRCMKFINAIDKAAHVRSHM